MRRGSIQEALSTSPSEGISDTGLHSFCDRLAQHSTNPTNSTESVITARSSAFSNSMEDVGSGLNTVDITSVYEERTYVPAGASRMKVAFERQQTVFEIRLLGKQPCAEKHGDRIVTNQWRRYGPLQRLSTIGGWAHTRNENAYREIRVGGFIPAAPNQAQMSLHQDRIRPICFDIPPDLPSDSAAHYLGRQIADRVIQTWNSEPWFDHGERAQLECLFQARPTPAYAARPVEHPVGRSRRRGRSSSSKAAHIV